MHQPILANMLLAPEPTPLHVEDALDEALRESFPASDPVAIDIAPPDADTAAPRAADA
jgi:hypothetical protein